MRHCLTRVVPTGGMKQKGIISYGIAPNRQFPLAGTAHDAIFNTWRRFSAQVLYWAPPMIAGYYILNWAIDRYAVVGRPPRGHALTHCQEPLPQLEGWPRRVCWSGGVRGRYQGSCVGIDKPVHHQPAHKRDELEYIPDCCCLRCSCS